MKEAMSTVLLIICLITISRHLFFTIERVTTLEKQLEEKYEKKK